MKLHKLNKLEFLYFVMAVFVFISTTALALNGKIDVPVQVSSRQAVKLTSYYPDNPVLGSDSSFPTLSAQGVYVIDLDSGVPLYEKNPDARLLPASTTKIITALVALDVYNLFEVIKIPKGVRVEGQKIGLYEGEEMDVYNLLRALLIYSANDSAEALARAYPLGREAFINLMNIKAMELSMNNTHFYNPTGFDGEYQYSTAKDLIRAVEVAMRDPVFAEIVGTKETTITDVSGKNKYKINNINKLLGEVDGVKGIKTGWTENARENLVTYVERNNHKVLIAILGSSDRFGETKELIDWIFNNYNWEDVKI